MSVFVSRMRHASIPVLAPLAFGVLTACGNDRDSRLDDQMRADLQAASQAMPMRGQFASPAELGYPQGYAPMPGYQGYAPYPGSYPVNYPQPYGQPYGYPQPAQQRVVYAPAPAPVRRSGTVGSTGTSGSGRVVQEQRNTQKGAIIGAATGAAIGVATSRDRMKGAAIGALGGAVLGGVIGHQVKTPR